MLVPAALSAVLFTPIVTSAAASLSPSLSPVVALLQLGTISGHPHRRQSSSSISFGGQSISLACEPTCASTAPTLAICEAKLDNNGCNAICNDLESYAQCINCVLLNDQGTGRNITEEVYQSSVMGNEFLYKACVRRGAQAPTTQLLPFDQIGTNATSHASTSAADRGTSLGAMGAVVVAGGAGVAWFL